MRLILSLFFLAWPLAEIAAFVLVGSQIGVLPTIGLVIPSGFVGILLLRIQGLGTLARIRAETDAGHVPGRDLGDAFMILLAGLLLLLPGFITDVLGILLFIPFVRGRIWGWLRSRTTIVTRATGFATGQHSRNDPRASRRPGRGPVIELDQEDFTREPNPNSPWRKPEGD